MADPAQIPVGIDLAEFTRQLQALPGLSAKEAGKMASVFARASVQVGKEAAKQANEAEKAARRSAEAVARSAQAAAREIDSSIGEQLGAIKGLSGAVFGGVAGDLFDLVDAARGASGGLAGLGLALGGVAVGTAALGALTAGVRELASAATEALPAVLDLVGPDAALAVQGYARSADDASVAVQVLTVELGALASDALAPLADELVRATPMLVGWIRALREAGPAVVELAHDVGQVTALLTGGGPGLALVGWVRGLYEAEVAATDAGQAIRLAAGAVEEYGPTLEQAGGSLDGYSASIRKVAAAAATLDPDSLSFAATGGMIEPLPPEVSATWTAYLEQLAEADALGRGLATSTAPIIADLQAMQATLPTVGEVYVSALGSAYVATVQLADAVSGQLLGGLGQLADAQQRQAEQAVSALEAQEDAVRDRYRTEVQEARAAVAATTGAEQRAAEMELALLEARRTARLDALADEERAQKVAARDAFRRSQSLQRAAAVIEGARAAVSLIPAFAILGPGAPAAAAAVAGAGLAVQLQVINTQEPPKFAFGGHTSGPLHAGGDVAALLERGESVVSSRGMAQPGAREIVDALNAGLSMPRIQEVYLDGISQGASTGHRRPGSARATLRTRYT